ncbi:putative dithiobiotin synthetase [Salmonella enterica subsp. enterica serovar Typhi]|nr:putative dithiobiotin synthetase [Salmonella enterica subsp. enterica serovar Typhi]
MLKRFFITGTDTSVGKTVVSRALLQALSSGGKSVAGYKPVAKGSKETPEGMRNKDALVLQSVSSLELPYEAINPIALSEEESSVAHSCPINYTLLSNGLANQGEAFHLDEPVVTPMQARQINALMATSGMYQNAGEFAWRVGLPAKSGVGGGIVAIVPHEMAIAVWSPELDPAGNSLAGIAALEQLTQTLGRLVY